MEIQVALYNNPRWRALCHLSLTRLSYGRLTCSPIPAWTKHPANYNLLGISLAWPLMLVGFFGPVRSAIWLNTVGPVLQTTDRSSMQADSVKTWQSTWWDPTWDRESKLTYRFSRWLDAMTISNATAPMVATMLGKWVFCYLGLLKQIYSDQQTQFESTLIMKLCRLRGVDMSHTTPYYSQANGILERNNQMQVILNGLSCYAESKKNGTNYYPTSCGHTGAQSTMPLEGWPTSWCLFDRELRLRSQLPPPIEVENTHEYIIRVKER